jgi:hypothetical protein
MMRQSIQPTYDSRDTGPAYTIRVTVNGRTVDGREIDDPFVRSVTRVGLWDMLRAILTGRPCEVEMTIGGEKDRLDDVLELDANYLIPNSTRQTEWRAEMHQKLRGVAVDLELEEMTGEEKS